VAIIFCPECGNKISDRAEICPHCGLPRRFFTFPNTDTVVTPSQDKFSGDLRSIDMQCKKCYAELLPEAVYCHICGSKQKKEPRHVKNRGNGQGTVFKLPNGKWQARATLSYEPIPGSDPPRVRRIDATRSDFVKKSDALAYLPILATELDNRKLKHSRAAPQPEDKTGITLKQLYDLWQPTHQKSKSTMNCYAAGFKVFEQEWDTPMRDLDIDDLQECMDNCEKGRRTRENARAALGLIYKYGIPRGYVPNNLSGKPNLAEFLRIGEGETVQKDGLNDIELKKLKDSIGKVPYADYVYCHCYLGFRPTEFINLSPANCVADGKAFVGGSKTDAGRNRIVTISPKIKYIVDRLVEKKANTVFYDRETGGPITIKKYREIFYAVMDACGIQPLSGPPHRLTPHSCRHTFATMMKRVKAPARDKLQLIGHTSEEMLRKYQDVSLEDMLKITDAL
jgi:integrase/uncharacterized OB-fold protein